MRQLLPLYQRLRHQVVGIQFLKLMVVVTSSKFIHNRQLLRFFLIEVVNLAFDNQGLSKAIELINISKRIRISLKLQVGRYLPKHGIQVEVNQRTSVFIKSNKHVAIEKLVNLILLYFTLILFTFNRLK